MFLFPISPAKWSLKNISKHLALLTRSSTKIIEFDTVKVPSCILSKDNALRKFFEIDCNSAFSKK